MLAEARALADRFPTVPARDLVRMATWEGARALGRDDLGRIARGARPGLFAIDGDPGDDPCAFVLRERPGAAPLGRAPAGRGGRPRTGGPS